MAATRTLIALAGFAAAAMSGANAIAQAYPVKPVRFIVPFAPGGAGDLVARAIAAKLAEKDINS